MFKQVSIPGKGLGLVATASLPVGTTIIEESPLILVEHVGVGSSSYKLKDIVTKFRCLTEEQKNQVLSLHDPGPTSFIGKDMPLSDFPDETEKKVLRIFAANCISFCGHPDRNVKKSGVYKTISRINHSCAPNAAWSWLQVANSIKKPKTFSL